MNLNFYKNLQLELKKYPQNPRFLAVTKYSSVEEINFAIKNWIKLIWENRLEIAEKKFLELKNKKNFTVEKHFIWAIQTKKLRKIFDLFDVIQSIWTTKQLEKINLISWEKWKKARIFLQFNISNEEQKSGFLEKEIWEILILSKKLKNIKIEWIMWMASNSEKKEIREQFKKAKNIFETLKKEILEIKELSIWMSGDYQIALEEWATIVRIWTALFKK